jgi:predicted MFS family arabinose efflux permease
VTPSSYRRYLLAVLLVILAFNQVDRLALGLLLQDIKVDLGLTDTQLGLLSGIAFALFYSVMGIPIARWADRGDRVSIISVTVVLWCGAVALCGVAGSFMHLLLIRVGVAIGEAGCKPPAYSLIADYFSRAERPRAVAIYALGAPLSVVIGYFAAGWLNQFYGWRTAFVLLGAPGLLLAALAWFTLEEPRRKRAQLPPRAAPAEAQLPTIASRREVWSTLSRNVTFRHLLISYSVLCFFTQGIFKWLPSFFVRSYGMQSGELGTWFTVILGLAGFVGTYLGGAWASRYAPNNERVQLSVVALGCCFFAVISAFIYLSSTRLVAFVAMGCASLGLATVTPAVFATTQTLIPDRMRATAIAVIYLFANLVGMGLGPLTAGTLSDLLRPWFGTESLRYALLALSPGYLWGAWHIWRASKTVAHDLRNVRDPPDERADSDIQFAR